MQKKDKDTNEKGKTKSQTKGGKAFKVKGEETMKKPQLINDEGKDDTAGNKQDRR